MKRIGKGNPADGFNAAIGERTKKLMTEGIYKHTRNPMLFGVFAPRGRLKICFLVLDTLYLR